MAWPFAGDLPDRKLTQEELDALFGTPEEFNARMDRFEANHRRAEDADIRPKHGGQYVAIVDGKVVAHGFTGDAMLEDALIRGVRDHEGWLFPSLAPTYVRPCPPAKTE